MTSVTSALPIVPPPREGELLGSWMQRIASVYDLSAHQLLDRWLRPQPSFHPKPSVEARVVTAGALADLVGRMRASPEAIQAMLPPYDAWLVECDTDIVVCTQCLLDDDAAGLPRMRRRLWAESWRVRCFQHKTLLVNMPDWRISDLEAVDPMPVPGLERSPVRPLARVSVNPAQWEGEPAET